MSIHTIGDSHSIGGWAGCSGGTGVIIHHIGPVLCYSFGKEKLDRCNIRNFNIKSGDTVIFCFGEIDCRCHIHRYINKRTTYQDIIDNIVDNYFEAIEVNIINAAEIKLKNICVYNVVPPIHKYNITEDLNYPHLGTDDERKNYVLYFNKKLKEKCSQRGYIFFDIYDKYTDENGFLRRDLSDGTVHIRNGIYISDFISENKL